jgi:hypothetical protein
VSCFVEPEDNSAFDHLLAVLEEMEADEQRDPRERLRELGAPAHLWNDLEEV